MIYFSIFGVAVIFDVLFPLFRASKDLIRDSQSLSFCNFEGLKEKAQDNIYK